MLHYQALIRDIDIISTVLDFNKRGNICICNKTIAVFF